MISSSFHDEAYAIAVLNQLRHESSASALSLLKDYLSQGISGVLLDELYFRLSCYPSPHIVIDTQWLSNQYGGISRVWHQILYAFTLPNLFSENSKLTLIDRGLDLPFDHTFSLLKADIPGSRDFIQVDATSKENSSIVQRLSADCFISTTISTASAGPICSEIALVHDCMPEYFPPADPHVLPLRQRWLSSCNRFLSVSNNTLNDLQKFYDLPHGSSSWCHPAPFLHDFRSPTSSLAPIVDFVRSLDAPFFFLPSPGSISSYKNIGLVAEALKLSRLTDCHLVLSGINASNYCRQLISSFALEPSKVHAVGVNDLELQYLYRTASAVIVPSLMEGYGLPVVETYASDGLVFVADSPGLSEAAGNCSLRFHPKDPRYLSLLLKLSLHPPSRSWLLSILRPRVESRRSHFNSDLIGLCLLALCRLS